MLARRFETAVAAIIGARYHVPRWVGTPGHFAIRKLQECFIARCNAFWPSAHEVLEGTDPPRKQSFNNAIHPSGRSRISTHAASWAHHRARFGHAHPSTASMRLNPQRSLAPAAQA